MKERFKKAFMETAERWARESSATRAQVGAIIVKDDSRIISIGYNGMPSGWNNSCEYTIEDAAGYDTGKTKPEVLHAETNAIAKVARSTESCEGATMFCTHSPCLECAKLIYQSGIATIYYRIDYNGNSSAKGKEFLYKSGVTIEQLEEDT